LDEYFRSIVCFKSKSGEGLVADVPNKMSPTGEVSMKTPTGSRKPKKDLKLAAQRVLAGITFFASNKKEEELVHGENQSRIYLTN